MQQYYRRLCVPENCSRKWNALVHCLTLEAKRTSVVEGQTVRNGISNGISLERISWCYHFPGQAWLFLFGSEAWKLLHQAKRLFYMSSLDAIK
ncbi:hypothetical protein ACSBR1_017500 [Camellia fascicularis]